MNKDIRKTYKELVKLDAPRYEAKKLVKLSYSFIGRCFELPKKLNLACYLTKRDGFSGDYSITKVKEYINKIDKISEKEGKKSKDITKLLC